MSNHRWRTPRRQRPPGYVTGHSVSGHGWFLPGRTRAIVAFFIEILHYFVDFPLPSALNCPFYARGIRCACHWATPTAGSTTPRRTRDRGEVQGSAERHRPMAFLPTPTPTPGPWSYERQPREGDDSDVCVRPGVT